MDESNLNVKALALVVKTCRDKLGAAKRSSTKKSKDSVAGLAVELATAVADADSARRVRKEISTNMKSAASDAKASQEVFLAQTNFGGGLN